MCSLDIFWLEAMALEGELEAACAADHEARVLGPGSPPPGAAGPEFLAGVRGAEAP